MKILNIKTKMKNEKLTKNFVGFTVFGKPHHKGITLMSLVITIVILLILGGAAVGIIVNENGFFDKTQNITNRWNDRISAEEQAIQNSLARRNKTTGETIIPILGSITLEPSNLALEIKEGENAEATIIATLNNISGTVSWTSSEPTVAIVDNNGKVTTVGAGTTTITASCGGKSATCSVTVIEKIIPEIKLDKSSVTLEIVDGVNTQETLTATKQNLTGTVSWTSSEPTVATVDNNGKVTTVGAGTTTITASCGGKTVTCEVTVEEYVTITVIQGSGVSIGHIREENGIVYYENCESIKLKVKKGTKVAFDDYILPEMGVWGDGPEDFPMTSEEYDSFVTSNSYGTFPERTLLPCFTSKCSISPIRYYNETLGYIDVENYYATETITFTMKDSD